MYCISYLYNILHKGNLQKGKWIQHFSLFFLN